MLERVKFSWMPQFHFKALGIYEEMNNPDKKVDTVAFREAKKLYLGVRGYSPIYR